MVEKPTVFLQHSNTPLLQYSTIDIDSWTLGSPGFYLLLVIVPKKYGLR